MQQLDSQENLQLQAFSGLLEMLCTAHWYTKGEHKDTHVQEIYIAISKSDGFIVFINQCQILIPVWKRLAFLRCSTHVISFSTCSIS